MPSFLNIYQTVAGSMGANGQHSVNPNITIHRWSSDDPQNERKSAKLSECTLLHIRDWFASQARSRDDAIWFLFGTCNEALSEQYRLANLLTL
jgi:hypothetical protein